MKDEVLERREIGGGGFGASRTEIEEVFERRREISERLRREMMLPMQPLMNETRSSNSSSSSSSLSLLSINRLAVGGDRVAFGLTLPVWIRQGKMGQGTQPMP